MSEEQQGAELQHTTDTDKQAAEKHFADYTGIPAADDTIWETIHDAASSWEVVVFNQGIGAYYGPIVSLTHLKKIVEDLKQRGIHCLVRAKMEKLDYDLLKQISDREEQHRERVVKDSLIDREGLAAYVAEAARESTQRAFNECAAEMQRRAIAAEVESRARETSGPGSIKVKVND